MTRPVRHRYQDPLDAIWLATAKQLGLRVERADDAYASYDGGGVLTIVNRAEFDPDDSLAQMIFHELCHALIAGPNALTQRDWGMSNSDERDLVREHACHRLQAALSDRHGLRALMAVTTDHRGYWDALPIDPLAPGADPAIELARSAWVQARKTAFGRAIDAALAATARVALAAAPFCDEHSLLRQTQALHASGFPLARDPTRTCGSCAWLFHAGPGRVQARCRQTRKGARSIARGVDEAGVGCERWEERFDHETCTSCGACCREGFDLVPVRAREAITKRHPSLIHSDLHGMHLPRPSGRCVALDGDGCAQAFRCRVYADRPRACAEFEVAADACLEARRRVGLSR